MNLVKTYWQLKKRYTLREAPFFERWHLDVPLIIGLLILMALGLIVLYSASKQDLSTFEGQIWRFALAFSVMLGVAQIPPAMLKRWAPWLFLVGCLLLIAVLLVGDTGKGAQRWLDLKVIRFQPSEILKIATPMAIAAFLCRNPLPPKMRSLLLASILIAIPMACIMKQPDLGTALMIGFSGACVLFLSGMSWRIVLSLITLAAASLPVLWHFMHNYQRQRVLTFLDPERDPLGNGYHIIQSKIAIGSGGLFGKGWLNGSQSQLDFIPEHATDFIFAVAGFSQGSFR
jgi:rod shape determining protein RodA